MNRSLLTNKYISDLKECTNPVEMFKKYKELFPDFTYLILSYEEAFYEDIEWMSDDQINSYIKEFNSHFYNWLESLDNLLNSYEKVDRIFLETLIQNAFTEYSDFINFRTKTLEKMNYIKYYSIYVDEPINGSHTEVLVKIQDGIIIDFKDISAEKEFEWDGWKVDLNLLIGKDLSQARIFLDGTLNQKYTTGNPYIDYSIIFRDTYEEVKNNKYWRSFSERSKEVRTI